jgi:multidrug resistance efflux pump
MKTNRCLIVSAMMLGVLAPAKGETQVPEGKPSVHAAPTASEVPPAEEAKRADRHYEEMLDRMQAAVEEVAQLYGNPTFLQVFTNDAERATELKQRLNAAQSGEDIAKELAKMKARRDEVLDDIALKEKEAARLSAKLVRQRAALDALAAALEQARTAVEDTTK